MKLGKRVGRGTFERLQLAIGQDPAIIATPETIKEHQGCLESYLNDLGLTTSDLKRLETYGVARRGYIRLKSGMRKRWVIVSGGENG